MNLLERKRLEEGTPDRHDPMNEFLLSDELHWAHLVDGLLTNDSVIDDEALLLEIAGAQ